MSGKAVLVFNPFAGRHRTGELSRTVAAELDGQGFSVTSVPTRGPGDATTRARVAASSGASAVFALGGDGTLRECAAGLAGSETALGFLPAGTVNVMAFELGLPGRPLAAARAHRSSRARAFDVGYAGDETFLMQCSAGFDARLIAELRSEEKRRLGRLAVLPATLRSLARYRFPSFGVETASGRSSATLAVVSNIRRYGGPWKIAPAASTEDGELDLVLHSGSGRRAILAFALRLLFGRHLAGRHCRLERVREATLLPAPGAPRQLDGERGPAAEPLRVTVARRALRMLIPDRASARSAASAGSAGSDRSDHSANSVDSETGPGSVGRDFT